MSRTILHVYELLFDSATNQEVRSKIRLHAADTVSLSQLEQDTTYRFLRDTYGPRMSFDAFFRFNGYMTVDEVAVSVQAPVAEVRGALEDLIRDRHVESFYLGGVRRYGSVSDSRNAVKSPSSFGFYYDRARNGLKLAWHNLKKAARPAKLYKRPPARPE